MNCELQLEGCLTVAHGQHHRQLRRHGDERAVNKSWVCAKCHTYIHDHPAEAYRKGWLVHSWDDPALVPWIP